MNFKFVDKDGNETEVVAKEGQHLLAVAHDFGVDLEGLCACIFNLLEPKIL